MAKQGKTKQDHPRYFIGTSGWTYDDWKGLFYPPTLPKTKWFEYYARQFNSVEINATFYRFFKDDTYQKWKQKAPPGFGYVLKAPQLITHRKNLLDVEDTIRSFYQSCLLLEDSFEMILLQVSPKMPYDPARLENALRQFPDPTQVAVEFRRAEWYRPETLGMLASLGVTVCNVDSPQHPITRLVTSTRAYLRMHGRRRWYADRYTPAELEEIAAAVNELTRKGAERVYIFFNNDFNANAPENALALRQILAG